MRARLAATTRCAWANGDSAMVRYHDREWGVPLHDDRRLFEFLILEGAQAGLFMQATGMVNDHTRDCFRWRELRRHPRGVR